MRWKRRRGMVACATAALLGASASTAVLPGAAAADTASAPADAPFLTMLVDQDGPPSMDTLTSLVHSTLASPSMAAVYDLLVFIDPATGDVETHLAESLEPNDDGSVWTMTLRPGVEFSDGTPFDAAAVEAELARLADPESRAAALLAAEEVAVTAVDELTVEFAPSTPDLNYDKVIALNFAMIPSPTAVAADPDGFGQNPVGAGPFVLTDWVVGETKTFEASPNYWQEGKPYLSGFETVAVLDHQQSINRLLAGDADLISAQQIAHYELGREAGLEVSTGGPLNGGFIWMFNHEAPPFDDVRVRQAFQLTVDSGALNELLHPDNVVPHNLFAAESPLYHADLDFPAPDVEQAQALIDEVVAESGELDVSIVTSNDANQVAYAEFAQAAFGQLDGVNASVESYAGGDWITRMRAGDYSLGFYTGWWSAPYPVFHQIYGTDGPLNYSNYSNPDVDALMEEARATADPDELYDLYGEITRTMTEEVAVIPFATAEVGFMHNGQVEDLRGVHLGNTPIWADVKLIEE